MFYDRGYVAERAMKNIPMKREGFRALLNLMAKIDPDKASRWCADLGKDSQPKELRQVASEVSGKLTDAASADLLLKLLKDSNAMVRLEAARSLGIRKAESAAATLAKLATDTSENAGVRVQAAWALARLGNDKGTEVLQQIADRGPDFAQSQARSSLDAIAAGRSTNTRQAQSDPNRFEVRYLDVGDGCFVRVE